MEPNDYVLPSQLRSMAEPWQDKETLRELYHGEGHTQSEIADQLGCSTATVSKWMRRYDIDTMDNRLLDKPGPWNDPEEIKYLHHDCKLTVNALSNRWGVCYLTAKKALKKHGIERKYHKGEKDYVRLYSARGYEQWAGENEHMRVHRLLAIAEGADPYELFDGKVVHHKNKIPWDNRPENIEVMTHSEHGKLHSES